MNARYKLLLGGAALTGVLGLAAFRYLFEGWDVQGDAMAPTLPNGAFVVSRRTLGPVKRGDVVVVADAPDGTLNLITRVIAVGGDTVIFHGSDLLLNGVPLLHEAPSAASPVVYETLDTLKYPVLLGPRSLGPDRPIPVPTDHVFVVADNRSEARDSRTFGPVSVHKLAYKVVLQLPSRH